MSTYGKFRTDPEREKAGIWVQYGPAGKFLLARAGGSNKEYAVRLEQLTRQHLKSIQHGMLDPVLADEILRQVYAEKVIRDWEGVTDEDGNLLPFSVANCVKLLKDLPELFRLIVEDAQGFELYRTGLLEEAVKN